MKNVMIPGPMVLGISKESASPLKADSYGTAKLILEIEGENDPLMANQSIKVPLNFVLLV